ncbi:YxlC family protein [Paenibacillus aquistagni]|uniref:Uncharacterized protein n=1 Tax=Paenibacillus aquistagni TaxID=1852522 RepID=A0A1X7I2M8_9BACL|nr:YxlC family protein [Paenibacillus aquistagni]SMG08205.1 hypothetical protein SAMN06295960_0053 [Paenibacillus aquistagni]
MTRDKNPVQADPQLLQDQELTQKLLNSWNQLDQLNERTPMPSEEDMFQMLVHHKRRLKHKLWKELAWLWILAAFVIAGSLILMHRELILYIGIQIALGIGAAGYLILTSFYRKKEMRGSTSE